MKIYIDGYEANVMQRLGSSQVAYQLLINLEKIDQINDYTILIPDPPVSDFPKERLNWRYKVLKPKRFWTRIALPLELFFSKKRPDLFFSPTHYIPWFSPVKRIVTIFDLSYLYFPDMFLKDDLWKLRNWSKFSIEHAVHIITISNFTKKNIIKEYKIRENKITVAYPGYDDKKYKVLKDKFLIEKYKHKYKITGDYVIFIGTVQPRKNLIRLIEAFRKIENTKLVIVGKTTGAGKQSWMFDEILKKPAELKIQNKVIFTGFVPEEELPYLLNGAKAFILASLWEGFGLTVVEAMASGVPVIVSNVSSMPEVVGKAGLLINPYSVDQIEQAIRLILTDSKIRNKKIKQGLYQAKKFSWEKMAKIVLKEFENI